MNTQPVFSSAVRLRVAAGAACLVLGFAAFGCGGDSDEETDSAAATPAHWGYGEEDGPSQWASLDPAYELCGDGKRQSPININGASASSGDLATEVDYRPEDLHVENNGHAIEAQIEDPDGSVTVKGTRYEIERFHFHTPSEEKINGKRFDASVHIVNTGPGGKTAVIGLLVEQGPSNPVMDKIVPLIGDSEGDENDAPDPINPEDLLPTDATAFEYEGSLTTPPCTEGLEWIVYKQPITMSADQLDALRTAYSDNVRPIQPVNGRSISVGQVTTGGQ
ncbi:MAG: carbonic anhydrase family protein [Solirubrobacterales bacterium]|nr:carbonic anhydrase family protein [Solirubrobacterales bacterium]